MKISCIVSVLALSLGFLGTGCSGAPEDFDAPSDGSGEADQAVYASTATFWMPSTTDGWTNVPVCWDTAGFATQKEWVRLAVKNTWEQAAKVRFTGWGTCSSNASGIRIVVDESGPRVTALGRKLDGKKNGMFLNFKFTTWSPGCAAAGSNQKCIEGIAVHEFGHALGLAHEHNRADSPTSCTDDPQGSNGDLELGSFDRDSVMNYCNGKWNNGGALSANDAARIADLYGGVSVSQPFACFIPPCGGEVDITAADGGAGLIRYGDLVALGGRYGKYLRMDAGSDIRSDQPHIGSHEKWTILDPVNGGIAGSLKYGSQVAFRGHTGKFLSARNDDAIGWASTIGPREIWTIKRPNNTSGGSLVDVGDPVAFWNDDQRGYLYDGQGNPEQRNAIGSGEVWYFRGPVSR